MISSCSASRSNRSPIGGKGIAEASCSRWYQPVPRPSRSVRRSSRPRSRRWWRAGRPAERGGGDERAEPDPAGVAGQSGQRRPAVGRPVRGSSGSTPNRWSDRKKASKPALYLLAEGARHRDVLEHHHRALCRPAGGQRCRDLAPRCSCRRSAPRARRRPASPTDSIRVAEHPQDSGSRPARAPSRWWRMFTRAPVAIRACPSSTTSRVWSFAVPSGCVGADITLASVSSSTSFCSYQSGALTYASSSGALAPRYSFEAAAAHTAGRAPSPPEAPIPAAPPPELGRAMGRGDPAAHSRDRPRGRPFAQRQRARAEIGRDLVLERGIEDRQDSSPARARCRAGHPRPRGTPRSGGCPREAVGRPTRCRSQGNPRQEQLDDLQLLLRQIEQVH